MSNKSISQLQRLDTASIDDLLLVSHLSSNGWQSMSVKTACLSAIYAAREDVTEIEHQLHQINYGEDIT